MWKYLNKVPNVKATLDKKKKNFQVSNPLFVSQSSVPVLVSILIISCMDFATIKLTS